jgi:hypothetical protein
MDCNATRQSKFRAELVQPAAQLNRMTEVAIELAL